MGPAFVCLLQKKFLAKPFSQSWSTCFVSWSHLSPWPVGRSVLYRECSKITHLNSSSNTLTSAYLQSCIVARYPFHVYDFLFSSMLSVVSIPIITVVFYFVLHVSIKLCKKPFKKQLKAFLLQQTFYSVFVPCAGTLKGNFRKSMVLDLCTGTLGSWLYPELIRIFTLQ